MGIKDFLKPNNWEEAKDITFNPIDDRNKGEIIKDDLIEVGKDLYDTLSNTLTTIGGQKIKDFVDLPENEVRKLIDYNTRYLQKNIVDIITGVPNNPLYYLNYALRDNKADTPTPHQGQETFGISDKNPQSTPSPLDKVKNSIGANTNQFVSFYTDYYAQFVPDKLKIDSNSFDILNKFVLRASESILDIPFPYKDYSIKNVGEVLNHIRYQGMGKYLVDIRIEPYGDKVPALPYGGYVPFSPSDLSYQFGNVKVDKIIDLPDGSSISLPSAVSPVPEISMGIYDNYDFTLYRWSQRYKKLINPSANVMNRIQFVMSKITITVFSTNISVEDEKNNPNLSSVPISSSVSYLQEKSKYIPHKAVYYGIPKFDIDSFTHEDGESPKKIIIDWNILAYEEGVDP